MGGPIDAALFGDFDTQTEKGGKAILNADDPRVAEIGLGLERKPVWFGLQDTSVAGRELPHAADARTCPRCGSSLTFTAVYLGHDGVYRCPNGDFARPVPSVAATEITLNGFDSLAMTVAGTEIRLPVGGLYNAYNALAAFATGRALGLEGEYVAGRMGEFAAAFERFRSEHSVLDILVNCAWGGYERMIEDGQFTWPAPFWS